MKNVELRMRSKAIYLFLLLNLLLYQKVEACFCIEDSIETADYSYYDELFLGKILNIERIEIYENETFEFVGTIRTFEVLKKWKGSDSKIVKIYQQQSSCGIDFSITSSRWVISAVKKSFVT